MAELTREEFLQRAGVGEATPPVAIPRSTPSLQRTTPAGEIIPFDTATGVPFLTRLNASLAPDPVARQSILQQSFATARVEPLPNRPDQFVIRDYVDPQTGQTKDLLVDEAGATLKDIADLGTVGVELLGAYAAIRGGRGVTGGIQAGAARTIAESAIANTGAMTAGALADVAGRAQAGTSIDPLEIAQRRSVGAMLGTGMDIGLGLPIAGVTHFLNLRRGVPQTQEAVEAVRARNRLAEDTGQALPFTLGQQTGNERIRQSEEFLENVAFGGGPQRSARLAQDKAIESMQNALIESSGNIPVAGLPNKEIVGNQAVTALRSLTRQAGQEATQARADVMTDALGKLSQALDSSTGFGARQIYKQEAGNSIQTFVGLKHDALMEIEGRLKQEALDLGADAPFVATPKAKQDIQGIVRQAYERPGTPGKLLVTTPGSVLRVLKDVNALPATATWDEIRRVRNSVNRLINEGQILGDTDTGVLKRISKTLTESIVRGSDTLAPEAKAAVARANKFYAEGIEQFQVAGITDLLADPTQKKLGPFDIFNQAADKPDQYFRLKKILTEPLKVEGAATGPVTAGEMTWSTFKQAMLTEIADDAAKVGNRAMMDPTKFLNSLQRLEPEVRKDLLGAGEAVALRSLKRLEALDDPKVPAQEALDLLRRGGDTLDTELLALAQREKELDQLYANQVIKKFTKGEIGAERIEPGEFVDRFAYAGPIADVKDAMNKIELASPGTVNLIREKMVQSIFHKAQQNPLTDEVAARKLAKELALPENKARLENVLGAPATRRLTDFLTVIGHIQRAGDKAAKMGGSMAGGGQKSQLLTLTGIIAAVPRQLQYWLVGLSLANPWVNRQLTRPVQPLDPTKLIRSIIVSDDAIKSLVSEFGHEAKAQFDLLNNLQPEGPGMSREEFLQRAQP